MGVYVPDMPMPDNCGECRFRSKYMYIPAKSGLYKMVACCSFAPGDIEDPWRDSIILSAIRAPYCPLIEMKVEKENE